MMLNSLHELIESKLLELRLAIRELQCQTIPHTPLPFFRSFKLLDERLIWPARFDDLCSMKINNKNSPLLITSSLVKDICEVCEYKPSKILKVIRRLEAAAEWCRKRAEGRKRAAEEILRQQKKAVDELIKLGVTYGLTNPTSTEELEVQLVALKLQELSEIVKDLLCKPMLCIPMSELSPIWIAPGVVWQRYPAGIARFELNPIGPVYECITDDTRIETISKIICHRCSYQPAKVLEAIKKIDEAIEWCKKWR